MIHDTLQNLIRLLENDVPYNSQHETMIQLCEIKNAYVELIIECNLVIKNKLFKNMAEKCLLNCVLEFALKEYKSDLWNFTFNFVESYGEKICWFDIVSHIRAKFIYISQEDSVECIRDSTSKVFKVRTNSENKDLFFKEDIAICGYLDRLDANLKNERLTNLNNLDVYKKIVSNVDVLLLCFKNKKYRWGKDKKSDILVLKKFSSIVNIPILDDMVDDLICIFKRLSRDFIRHNLASICAKIPDGRYLSVRNVAFYRLAKLLGVPELSPKSFRCFLVQDSEIKTGMMMDQADGCPINEMGKNNGVILSANAQLELMRLQMLDYLAGQVDRHVKNYFINTEEISENKRIVNSIQAIDNDFSFGLLDYKNFGSQNMAVTLPRLFDDNDCLMCGLLDDFLSERIWKMKEYHVRYLFTDLLCEDEMVAFMTRIAQMKFVINNERNYKKKDSKIIKMNQWGKDTEEFLVNEDKINYVKKFIKGKRKKNINFTW